MTAPSKMVIGEANDRTTEGVSAVSGTAAMKAAGSGGVWLCVARFVTASLSLVIARRERGRGFARRAGGRAWAGERCDPLARSGRGSGAGCRRGGPELGGAAAGEGASLAGAAGSDESVECLFDAVGGEVALAEVADLGAGEPVG
jgi:hypothetical protein